VRRIVCGVNKQKTRRNTSYLSLHFRPLNAFFVREVEVGVEVGVTSIATKSKYTPWHWAVAVLINSSHINLVSLI